MRGALLVLLTIVSVACAASTFPFKPKKRDPREYYNSVREDDDQLQRAIQYFSKRKRTMVPMAEKEKRVGQIAQQQVNKQLEVMDEQQASEFIDKEKRTEVPMDVPAEKEKRVGQIAQQAVNKQLEIMGEQQEKASEFIDKKLDINIVPDKGWQTEDLFVPSGFHIDAEITGEDTKPSGSMGEQPFVFPMGVGGMIMNGCYDKNYGPGDPCYQAKWKTTICLNLIDGANFIGVGFDGRGEFNSESRKMSIVQRDCSAKATYDDLDVPDTMNVHGVYDTSATMQTFSSRTEYQTFLQRQAGMAGSAFGFYAGVKKAWGSSTLSGGQQYMGLFSIDIDRYEIYLDEVKPTDLSVNFLQEFMALPLSYLAPGAAIKFQDFILRWGTHYIKSGKFGGRLQIFKTMEGNQVSSKEEFSQVMEMEFRSMFASFHAKDENKEGSGKKSQSKTSSTSMAVEGGDQEIASLISDVNSPTIKNDIKQWLGSIRTFPKPFKFMVAPITDLLKFTPSSLFTDEERDWGCEAQAASLKKDPDTGESYYEVKINGTLEKKMCPYKDRDDLEYKIERRRNQLERAIGVYMEEGPISVTEITLPAGKPGCQTENFKFQEKASVPSWDAIKKDSVIFVVIFSSSVDLVGSFKGPVSIKPSMEKYVRYFDGEWFTGTSHDNIDMTTSCSYGSKNNKICILGLVLTYNPQNGYLTLEGEDLELSKGAFPVFPDDKVGTILGHVEWPSEDLFQMDLAVGFLPCNVKWSNALRFDPSQKEGKCLHFTASSKGTVFVLFAANPEVKSTWYYVQISSEGVGIFKDQKLKVSTVDINAVGLGSDILYQSYFVCLKETSESTVIEYGKSQGMAEFGDVYLTMIDRDNPLSVRLYAFGNGEKPLEVVDAHIVSRHLTKAKCRGDTVLDEESNMCLQHCHEMCDPTQGCRGTSKGKPLASNCNACRYVKIAATGECVEECPDGTEDRDGTCFKIGGEEKPCDSSPCLNNGYCTNEEGGKYSCECQGGWSGDRCDIEPKDVCTETEPVGISDPAIIPDNKMTASSYYKDLQQPAYGRLNGGRGDGWCTKIKDSTDDWLQVDLGKTFQLCGISTQGDVNGNEWVTDFKLSYSLHGDYWTPYKDENGKEVEFHRAAGKKNQVDHHKLPVPVSAQFVRFIPTGRVVWNCFRVELFAPAEKPCDSRPCLNNGYCTNEEGGKYSCECQSGWLGDRCDIEKKPCESSPCLNDGHCKNEEGGKYSCVCPSGWSGDRCDIASGNIVEEKPCDSSPCLNDGTCTNEEGGKYSCECQSGWSGDTCDIASGNIVEEKPCDSSPCLNDGTCSNEEGGKYSCECQSGWSGESCDIEEKPCDSSPCLNDGTCSNEEGGKYSCECQSGWSGESCDIGKPCDLSPCLNDGTCINEEGGKYSCECQSGWSGDRCDEQVDVCAETKPVGISDPAKIPDNQMTASTYYKDFQQPGYGRLNGDRGDGWCTKTADGYDDWLQVDLGKPFQLCGMATQGDRNNNEWVTDFKLSYSLDGNNWTPYKDASGKEVEFHRKCKNVCTDVNLYGDKADQHKLPVPVSAQYVRFHPTKRYRWNCLRVELYAGEGKR